MTAGELMFAIEDEIGDGEERPAKFARGAAVQTTLGARSILVSEQAGPLERTRIAHQRRNLLRAHAVKSFFFEHSAHHATASGAIIFERVNEGQRHFAFF